MLNKLYFYLILLSMSSCSQNKNQLSGYIKLQSEISSDDVSETFMPGSILTVNEKGDILEYNERLKRIDGKFKGSDTLNIFFINTKKGIYSAYKKLDMNEKPYLNDNIDNKREGVGFFSKKVDFFSDIQNIKLKDTLIGSIKYKFAVGSKIADQSTLVYQALIAPAPQNFPAQISKILSNMTGGGFVEKVWIIDKANNRIMTFKCSYEHKKLPDKIDKIMKAWANN